MPSRQPSASPDTSSSRTHFPIAPPIASGAGLCSALLIFYLFFKKFRWNRTRAAAAASNSPRRYSYAALKKATLNFSESKRVGQGGFGSVYVGMLPGKKEVAVKLMDSGSLQGERVFQNELIVAEKIDSEYVLKLLGFASCRKHMGLVYEYMCNGSLQDALLLKKDIRLRDWERRYLIALDVARGIEYLHRCDPSIVHCDVKPGNVLLDGVMRAKIGDFGLARFKEVEGKQVEDVVEMDGGIKDVEFVKEETESVTTMTTVGMDDFSVCMDHSPESVFKGAMSDEQSPFRNESQGVVFSKISEGRESVECSTRGDDDVDGGKGMKEIIAQGEGDDAGQRDSSGTVKEYVMEWIGTDVKNERAKRGWIDDSSENEVKAKTKRKKKKKHPDWWVTLDEDKNSKKVKRRPAREWWKEEYARDLMKKQKKNKRLQTNYTDNEFIDSWWSCNDGSNKSRKFNRSGSKRSRGSLDWWLDGLSGESWRGGHNSHDSCSGEFPKSGAMSSTPSMRGTVCYVAPEYCGVADNVNFSDKCDVYSYGVLLLVIIAGRRPLQVTGSPMSEFKRANLVSWARHLARAGKVIELVDKSLQSVNQDQALRCIKVALLCIQKTPSHRPSMKEVVGILSGALSLPDLPSELSPSRFPHTAHKKIFMTESYYSLTLLLFEKSFPMPVKSSLFLNSREHNSSNVSSSTQPCGASGPAV